MSTLPRYQDLEQYITDFNKFITKRGQLYVPAGEKMEVIESDILELYYQQSLHGNSTRNFLAIPSIFNSSQILDFTKEASFINLLRKHGNVYLVNWREPRRNFGLEDIILELLTLDIDIKFDLVGHCLGGVLAIAMASLDKERYQSLTLLTTPWDFSHFKKGFGYAGLFDLQDAIETFDIIPRSYFQIMFYLFSQDWSYEKLSKYFSASHEAQMKQLTIEGWLGSGINIPFSIYQEIAEQFVKGNCLASGNWEVRGNKIQPESIEIPTFMITAEKDRLVPKTSHAPLMDSFLNIEQITMPGGHIGYLASPPHELPLSYGEWTSNQDPCK